MIRPLRVTGFLLIAVGCVILLTWLIKPLRFLWPWFRALPWAIQLGLAVAAVGLLFLIGSLLWERFQERHLDRDLRENE